MSRAEITRTRFLRIVKTTKSLLPASVRPRAY
jgi:hypothetical protein